jgi:two-component system NarL family sensor kinase
MSLKTKILLLAALPLLAALALIAWTVLEQDRALAQRERALVEQGYMDARRTELRHYVQLGASVIMPLHDSGRDDAATRAEAIRLLSSLDYGHDGYFFLYDMQGTVLAHSRQPELVGRNLWELRDPLGRPTIQRLIARAPAAATSIARHAHRQRHRDLRRSATSAWDPVSAAALPGVLTVGRLRPAFETGGLEGLPL